MKVVVYYRQPPSQPAGPVAADRELGTQRANVAAWLAETGATVAAEFTETETGTKSRPAYGRARAAAVRDNATLLVATTKALGPAGPFKPVDSYDGPALIRLVDPSERERELWARSEQLIVYYRQLDMTAVWATGAGGAGPGAGADAATISRRSLEKQRDGVQLIAHPHVHTILAEFTEVESPAGGTDGGGSCGNGGGNGEAQARPQLSAALALCRQMRARLVIGTTDAIGPAPAFQPDTGEVPTEIAWRDGDQWDAIVDAPSDAVAPFVGLHLGRRWVRNRRPLYLANRSGGDLVDVTVHRTGWSTAFGDPLELEPLTMTLDHVADGTSRLAGDWDVFMLADFMVSLVIEARDAASHSFRGTITVSKGASPGRLLVARDWQRTDAVAATEPAG